MILESECPFCAERIGKQRLEKASSPVPTNATLEPEGHYVVDRCPNLRVFPIEIRLFRREQREVVLVCLGIVGPLPISRRQYFFFRQLFDQIKTVEEYQCWLRVSYDLKCCVHG